MEDLKLRCAGNIVLNPAVLPDGLSQQQYMSICIPMLMCADAIYLLDGWEEPLAHGLSTQWRSN